MKDNWKRYVFAILVFSFFAFSLHLYSIKNFEYRKGYNSKLAQNGELVWQKYNCQSCHQMYGLGGYLGPDLTNVLSVNGKNATYVLAVIQTGNKQMPANNLSEDEKTEIIEFLKSTDASGVSDPRSFVKQVNGMISKDGNGN